MSWTEIDDVKHRYNRTITDQQKPWVASLIDDAEDELSLQVSHLAERIATEVVPLKRVKRIVAAAVIGVLRNPDGYISQSSTRGPFSNSVTRAAGSGAAGRIVFSEEDLASLRPVVAPVTSVGVKLSRWQIP